ncbi:hypothetical protein F5888DRAFT_1635832 [Russula emetica]|nr:hypothetical protein F5888DRAFT_1635832 [Russula emetica]
MWRSHSSRMGRWWPRVQHKSKWWGVEVDASVVAVPVAVAGSGELRAARVVPVQECRGRGLTVVERGKQRPDRDCQDCELGECGNKVGLELVQINIQRTVKAKGCCDQSLQLVGRGIFFASDLADRNRVREVKSEDEANGRCGGTRSGVDGSRARLCTQGGKGRRTGYDVFQCMSTMFGLRLM